MANSARLSERVRVEWIEASSLEDATEGQWAVSRPGTLSAAHVSAPNIEPFLVVSMYSLWSKPHATTGSSWIVSDASAHRVVSDLSALIGRESGHRILAAGDLNILHGHGENGNEYWASRYATVFTRMEALGLPSSGAARAAGGPLATGTPQGQQERPHVPLESADTENCNPSAGLRLRLQGNGRFRERPRAQRTRPVGRQRPLPPGDRGPVVPNTGTRDRKLGDRAERCAQGLVTRRLVLPRCPRCGQPSPVPGVQSEACPGFRSNGPPLTMSSIGSNVPGALNSSVVPSASPAARPSRQPRNRSRVVGSLM